MSLFKPRAPTLVVVPDEGAVRVLLEALETAGIQATVRRIPYDPYRPAISATSFEIRVPAAALAQAQQVMAALEHEAAVDLDAQALAAGRPRGE
jgi:hypothetical protein